MTTTPPARSARQAAAALLALDLAWGVLLTTLAALAGRAAHDAVREAR